MLSCLALAMGAAYSGGDPPRHPPAARVSGRRRRGRPGRPARAAGGPARRCCSSCRSAPGRSRSAAPRRSARVRESRPRGPPRVRPPGRRGPPVARGHGCVDAAADRRRVIPVHVTTAQRCAGGLADEQRRYAGGRHSRARTGGGEARAERAEAHHVVEPSHELIGHRRDVLLEPLLALDREVTLSDLLAKRSEHVAAGERPAGVPHVFSQPVALAWQARAAGERLRGRMRATDRRRGRRVDVPARVDAEHRAARVGAAEQPKRIGGGDRSTDREQERGDEHDGQPVAVPSRPAPSPCGGALGGQDALQGRPGHRALT